MPLTLKFRNVYVHKMEANILKIQTSRLKTLKKLRTQSNQHISEAYHAVLALMVFKVLLYLSSPNFNSHITFMHLT